MLRSGICLGVVIWAGLAAPVARGESLPEALAKAYQTNPQLNAERARQRATDENVPQALAGYRPQIIASLSGGLQAVRNLLPDNTVQSATLKPWIIGVTVTQTLFNGFKTASSVRVAELQVQSGREALRNVGQGVLLDAVTAYTNVLANQSLVEAQRANVAFLRETLGTTRKRDELPLARGGDDAGCGGHGSSGGLFVSRLMSSYQIRPSAVSTTCGVSGISVMVAPNGRSASFTAFATAAAAPAVPASPAPLAPSSVSDVGDTTWLTSISGISPDIGTR